MGEYVRINRKEMEAVLVDQLGFEQIFSDHAQELIYGKRPIPGKPLSIRVYSSIGLDGLSRDSGEDAIRITLMYRNQRREIKFVGRSKRINRVEGWEDRLTQRIERWKEQLGPDCPQCHEPTILRNGKYGHFWGCASYPDCRGTAKVHS